MITQKLKELFNVTSAEDAVELLLSLDKKAESVVKGAAGVLRVKKVLEPFGYKCVINYDGTNFDLTIHADEKLIIECKTYKDGNPVRIAHKDAAIRHGDKKTYYRSKKDRFDYLIFVDSQWNFKFVAWEFICQRDSKDKHYLKGNVSLKNYLDVMIDLSDFMILHKLY